MTTSDAIAESPFRSVNSKGFAALLESLGITLLVTTYQAGKLMAIRGNEGRVSTLLRGFERPMGLAVRAPWQIALGTRNQVWFFRNAPDIAPQIPPIGKHDACFLPRFSHVTGDIRCHEMAWVQDELWIVNTFFSCLCSVSRDFSFVPRWSPPFMPKPTPGDHCHLNGLAVVDSQPRYVTALGETNTPEGWRPTKADGGILLDVASGSVISRGLSMPHSPRWYADKLWILESGTGQLQTIEIETGKRTVVAQLPGFARGLSFLGPYAFIGLSKIRESNTFGNLPITKQGIDLQCGIWVVDVRSGQTVQFMQFQAGVEEIFAVEILTGIRFPGIVGFQQDTVHGAYVIPPGAASSADRK
ncbi:MAG: TIGR03032 family protein [Planctomycetes bacterium]|nr:TIGR03032 family protein [Planctomycetota bacterium]